MFTGETLVVTDAKVALATCRHIDAALYALCVRLQLHDTPVKPSSDVRPFLFGTRRNPPKVTTLFALSVPEGPTQTVRYDDGTGDELPVPIGTTACEYRLEQKRRGGKSSAC